MRASHEPLLAEHGSGQDALFGVVRVSPEFDRRQKCMIDMGSA